MIDWSGNCGNLSTAVGPFAIDAGLVEAPADGIGDGAHLAGQHRQADHRHVPMKDGAVQELGDFELDGVAFPAAEVKLEFLDPADDDGSGEAARCSRPATASTRSTCRASARSRRR